jgi:hypothetical protein
MVDAAFVGELRGATICIVTTPIDVLVGAKGN